MLKTFEPVDDVPDGGESFFSYWPVTKAVNGKDCVSNSEYPFTGQR